MSDPHERRLWPARAHPASPLVLAVLLSVLTGGFGWSGYTQWRASATAERLGQVRDQVVSGVERGLTKQTRQLEAVLKDAQVATALARGDAANAGAAIGKGFPGAQEVQVLASDLADAYAEPARFGYARLELLEAAQLGAQARAQVVSVGGRPQLGVAAPVHLARTPALVYLRLPLAQLTAALDKIDLPAKSYLALRQGGYDVVQKGLVPLAGEAESLARPIGQTGLRIVAAVAQVDEGPFGCDAATCGIVALLLALLSALIVVVRYGRLPLDGHLLSRLPLNRKGAPAAGADAAPTLTQALQQLAPTPDTGTDTDLAAEQAQPSAAVAVAVATAVQLPAAIFRGDDICGVVGDELTPAVCTLIGAAVGSVMHEQGLNGIVVGHDGRVSGPELASALIEGLRGSGCRVIDVGQAPTPVVYFAAHRLHAGGCVAVTGSHNPPEYNGLKALIGGRALSGEAIVELRRRIDEGRLHQAEERGVLEQRDISGDYIQQIADDVQLQRPLRVVADAGNGAAGEIAPRLLEAIGAEVVPLYCEIDGSFPNHYPDPSDPHNLRDLVQMVERFDADLGVAFDGDGDRLAVVTRQGEMVLADRLLMLFAADVLRRNPGALVIYDVRSTGKLTDFILLNGGSPMMCGTGLATIRAEMRGKGAELAGEMSGHFFFKERWYGFDDGLYAAARLLDILAQREDSLMQVLAELPASVATPEIEVPAEDSAQVLERFVAAVGNGQAGAAFAGARLSTMDGFRADFPDGWGLLRASDTAPALMLRFEADDVPALARIQDLFRAQLQSLLPNAVLDF